MDFIIGNTVVTETTSFVLRGLVPIPRHIDTSKPLAQNTAAISAWLVRSRRQSNKKEVYIKSLEHYLRRFAEHFPDLSAVTTAELELWLEQFKSHSSRATWLSRINTLLNFAVRRDLLQKNVAAKIENITVDRPEPVRLNIEQAKTLVHHCPLHLWPYLALALFAGIRPDEVLRMDWRDIDLSTKTARVNGKTRRRRIVPLEPAAVKMLASCRQVEGKVSPSRSTIRRWMRKMRYLLPGGRWTIDILRHTAASMLLAKYGDAGRVSTMLGNSPQILLTHYNNPVTKEESERFWQIRAVSDSEPLRNAA